jgi:predicted MPP superfamily phosphohydrolase
MGARGKRWSRRKFLAVTGVSVATACVYARWLEPQWLAIRRHEIPLGRTRPIRLLQLSDFHASEEVSLDFIGEAVRAGLALKPDLICLTGDFITWRYEQFGRYAEVLKPLADAAPTYAVLGNHDGGRWVGTAGYSDTSRVRELLTKARIELLHNQTVPTQICGQPIILVGVGDLWAEELDSARAFSSFHSVPAEVHPKTIVLAHNPDSKDRMANERWDLMLSGHTHGGQCDLVFFGTPFAPVRDRRFVRGLHQWNGRWIHVTAGVGNLHGVRFNCRPDIALLTLT